MIAGPYDEAATYEEKALLAQKEAEQLTKAGSQKALAAWEEAARLWRRTYECLEEAGSHGLRSRSLGRESLSRVRVGNPSPARACCDSWDRENRYRESLANRCRDGFDGWGA